MEIHIDFIPRQDRYDWAIHRNGEAPKWHDGKRNLDDTKNLILEKFPKEAITFIVSE